MQLQPIFDWDTKYPILIAGPCSAESEQQVIETARQLKARDIDLFRAGIWKPRTRPGSFEGVGAIGLPWLQRVQEEFGMKVTAEAAKASHVEALLKHNVDVVWIGARTTANPFSVQEIAESLQGVDIPVLIKNPTNPDYKLWVGAIERIYGAGIKKIGIVHRGFSSYNDKNYRNNPMWQIPLKMKELFPEITMICDNSHICGKRDNLAYIAQHALNIQFDGLMTEVHPNPSDAWSDAKQQLTPAAYIQMINDLSMPISEEIDQYSHELINTLRKSIDDLDKDIIELIIERMGMSKDIGSYKKEHNMTIYQPGRWQQIRKNMLTQADPNKISKEFILEFLSAMHQESINVQEKIIQEDKF